MPNLYRICPSINSERERIQAVRQQETAEEGQIVVALIDNEATLKRYYLDNRHKRIRLHPENDKMEDMFYKTISIQGVAVKVIKDLQ